LDTENSSVREDRLVSFTSCSKLPIVCLLIVDGDMLPNTWKESFIIVDIAASGAYVLTEVDVDMLPNTYNADQLHKYYV
jgi:hypothetical protein